MRKTLALLFVSLTACGGSDSATGPTGTTNGTFTATIDGQAWVSTSNQITGGTASTSSIPGYVILTGSKVVSATNYTTLTLALGYLAGTGTYPLGVNPVSTAGGSGLVFGVQGTGIGTWSTNFTGNAGTLTITSLTATRIVGTFQFTAPPQSFTTTTGTRVVTNGAFDLPLPGNFVVAPATNKGSKISGTVGGAAWNAATVIALGANGVFTIGGTTDSLSLSLSTGRTVTAGSSYPIGGTGGAQFLISKTGTSLAWSSAIGTASVGTLTIASLTANRVAGSFAATLLGGAGTSGSLVVNATFDVRVDTP
jgi:hypothetical protein